MANLTFQQIEQLVAQAGGTPTQQEYLAGIAAGVESGGNPTAQNPTSTASGLWQELTSTWLGNGGGQYAPTAKQASPIDQAIVAVRQSTGGYQPWAPDFGGAYGAPGAQGNPQTPAPGSPVANYLKSIGVSTPGGYPTGAPAAGPAQATLSGLPGGPLDPLNWPGEIGGAVGSAGGGAIGSALLGVLGTITDPLKRFVEDAGLVVLGVILFAVAIVVIAHSAGGGSSSSSTPASPAPREEPAEEERPEEHEEESESEEHEEEPRQEEHEEKAPRDTEGHREAQALEHEAERAPEAAAAAAAG